MGISRKVYVIARLEFELAYHDVEIQHVCHDATGESSSVYACIGHMQHIMQKRISIFDFFFFKNSETFSNT